MRHCPLRRQRPSWSRVACPSPTFRGDTVTGRRRWNSQTVSHTEKSLRQPFPVSAAAKTILQSLNSELTPEELSLKDCWQRYEQLEETSSYDDIVFEELQQAYMTLGFWKDALELEQAKCRDLQSTRANNHEKDSDDAYFDSIHIQGKLHLRQEDFRTSKELYDQALEYFTTTENQIQRGHVLISLAGWNFFQNQLDRAMQALHEAEPLLDSNPALLVKCLDNQGLIHRLQGEFDRALEVYKQAMHVAGDEETEQALQLHVADMLVALEQVDEALLLYQQLVELATRTKNRGIQGVLWHNIATIHVEQRDYELALEEFRRALQIKQETGGETNPEVAKTWNSLGALHAGVLDEKHHALECFQQALLISRIHAPGDPNTDPDVLSALQNISQIEQQIDQAARQT